MKTQIWIAVSVYVLVAIVKKRLDLDASLYTLLQILSVTLFAHTSSTCGRRKQMQRFANNQPIEFIRFLTDTRATISAMTGSCRGPVCPNMVVPLSARYPRASPFLVDPDADVELPEPGLRQIGIIRESPKSFLQHH